jgi:ATP-citrate lyase beta-subunit
MRLYESEGKVLFHRASISVPRALLCDTDTCSPLIDATALQFPVYVKAQTLTGNRADRGGVVRVEEAGETAYKKITKTMIEKGVGEESIQKVLVEEAVLNIKTEHYLSFRWDTATRGAVVLYSKAGGTHIEQREGLEKFPVDILNADESLQSFAKKSEIPFELLKKFWSVFYENDALLVEINPLFECADGSWIAGDAKVELDDVAAFRHTDWSEYPERTLFARPPSQMEQEARKVSAMDHRGVAGASFFEFDGEIGILASGGGASQLAMDALMASGLKPANYTEYSGNPPREKVAALTKLVLTKKGLRGLWVIGGNANFTDIYETLAGVMDGIEATMPKVQYPIVVRRGGPRWEEAFAMVKERAAAGGFQITLFGPETSMLETVGVLVDQVKAKGKR